MFSSQDSVGLNVINPTHSTGGEIEKFSGTSFKLDPVAQTKCSLSLSRAISELCFPVLYVVFNSASEQKECFSS